jgi:hypothetical protein
MRKDFEKLFQATHPLRMLASEIATYQCTQAQKDGFFSATPPPYNFLANGWVDNYKPPLPPIGCPLEIAKWKFAGQAINCCLAQGFNEESLSNKGLSLLFDPLVDAVLYANMGGGGKIQLRPTVIVLSDYSAIWDADIKLIGYGGSDWGEEEARSIFNLSKSTSTTEINLWDCICEGDSWRTHPDKIQAEIRRRNILIWNFMPFFRGGADSTGASGLPKNCANWKNVCWRLLLKFVLAIAASQIVLAVNKNEMIDVKRKKVSEKFEKEEVEKLKEIVSAKYPIWSVSDGVELQSCERPNIFSINHPCVWKDGKGNPRKTKTGDSLDHSTELIEEILKLPSPIDVLDKPVDE